MAKSTAEYFSHDTDASLDEKIIYLESLFGDSGYAWFFKMLETLGRSNDFEIEWSELKCGVLARKFNTTQQEFNKFIVAATNPAVRAFVIENGKLYSPGLKNRLEKMLERRRKEALRIAEKRANGNVGATNNHVDATGAQSKVKESKVKNINNNTAAAENAFSGDETDEDFKKIGSIGEAAPVIDMQSRFESMLQDAHDSPANFEAFVRGRKIPREKYDEYWPAFKLEARVKKDKLHSQTDVSTYWLNFSSFRYEKEQRAAAGNGQKSGIKSFQNGRASLNEKQVF